ncbi:hypothetical protein RO3G_07418 [Rhizopus delemar RA 99-880]|uniref:Uncharacterized protein n=1 Tax=Rhizopus delemar (strain RA 99-880 / ATCC MYA-4621 / FGSC 9543 / NRRL 43880) TaxID=246409 RepID=I1C2N3_RHIO9|nr:hypothetical protein RO3G_07418 [Rhizopus delemar RA 99-880]|eukprot:EIE82713.1 hypothetical protein RO3G_07418 [Rhizopus delemar RA 99-880]
MNFENNSRRTNTPQQSASSHSKVYISVRHQNCQSRITTEEGGMSMGYVIDEGDESNLKASKNTREYSLLQWDLISK